MKILKDWLWLPAIILIVISLIFGIQNINNEQSKFDLPFLTDLSNKELLKTSLSILDILSLQDNQYQKRIDTYKFHLKLSLENF